MGFTEVLRWHGRNRPAKPALVQGSRVISYGSLDRRIDGLCHVLVSRGIARGDLVGVALGDDMEHIVFLLALARLGAVLLPLDRRWRPEEKTGVAERFGAAHVVVAPDEFELLAHWHRAEPGWFAEGDIPYVDPAVTMASPLLLSLSSGTTGLPKGPRLTHEQFVNRFMVYWIDMGLCAADRFVVATPLYFGGGRAFPLAMLWAGATADIFPPPYRPDELVAHVNATGATAMFLVPTLLRRLLADAGDQLVFPGLKVLISSGSALYGPEQEQVRARLTPNLYQYYSSTEAGGVSVLTPGDFEGRADSVGRPCFRVEVEVVDHAHRPVPRGEVGRLRYRSAASPASYYLGESQDAFHDGFFYPGDLATIDEDGFVYLRGRAKDIIIRGGVNIHPADIETALQGLPGIIEAAVVAMPSVEHGEEVAAFVVTSRPVSEAELTAACRERLAPFKVPKAFFFMPALPRNAGGKVVKSELQARFATGGGTATGAPT